MMKKQTTKLLILSALSVFSTETFAQPNLIYQATPGNSYGLNSSNKLGDIDNDGDLDLIISGYSLTNSNSSTILYRNDGGNQFILETTLASLNNGSVHFADIDNDNDLDIFLTGEDDSFQKHSKLFINDGTGVYTEDLTQNISPIEYSDADFGDVDGDGDLDLIITGESTSSYINELYLNDGSGNFTLVTGTSFSPGRGGHIQFFDVDGDSDLDFLVTGGNVTSTGANTDLYINDGSGNFTVDNTLAIDDFAQSSFDIADVDGDGDLDVLMNGKHNSNDESVLYLNDGSGNFTQSAGPTFMGGVQGDIKFGDLDGNNTIDFIVQGWGPSFVTVLETYLNDGSGNFSIVSPSLYFPAGARNGEISIGDVNANGLNDVFMTGYRENGTNFSHYYRNFTPPCENSSNITVTACDSYTVPSGDETYTTSGTYEDTVLNVNNCDSVITINLTVNSSSTSTENATACGSYTWNGNTYSTSGTYNETIPNHLGCDSLMTLNLVINQEATGTDVQTACDSYTWIDGNTYMADNSSATFTITGGAANGCDSIVTLDLTINNSYSEIDAITACDSYTWIDGNTYTSDNNSATQLLTSVGGCDSLVTLNLTINNSSSGTDTQTACNEFTWIDGNTYTSDNSTATFVLTNSVGCDSTVTLDLTINTINSSVTVSNGTITADYSGGTYQWIDCDDNDNPITGEVGQSYTPQTTGSYAVIISDVNCSVTSDCEQINTSSIGEFDANSDIIVSPNPNNGEFFIEINNDSSLEILDLTGKVINVFPLIKGKNQVRLSTNSSGIYILKINTEHGVVTRKVAVNN